MSDEVTTGAGGDDRHNGPRLVLTGPIGRAAPAGVAPSGGTSARSRLWLIAGVIAVAALLGGASAALTSAGPGQAHPAHAVARPAHARQARTVAAADPADPAG